MEASRASPAEEEVAASGVADAGKPATAKNRMPKDHVKWILAQKPLGPPPRYASLKARNPDLTPRPGEDVDEDTRRLYTVAKAFYEMEEPLPKVQAWVRAELESKGYVEVDEDWFQRRAAVRAVVDRVWPTIQAKLQAMVQEDEEFARHRDVDGAAVSTRRKRTRGGSVESIRLSRMTARSCR